MNKTPNQSTVSDSDLSMLAGSESVEIVPEIVSRRVNAMAAGQTIIGGRNIGKTWAMKIATAKPAKPARSVNSIQNSREDS